MKCPCGAGTVTLPLQKNRPMGSFFVAGVRIARTPSGYEPDEVLLLHPAAVHTTPSAHEGQ
jgi:hypothetical protein